MHRQRAQLEESWWLKSHFIFHLVNNCSRLLLPLDIQDNNLKIPVCCKWLARCVWCATSHGLYPHYHGWFQTPSMLPRTEAPPVQDPHHQSCDTPSTSSRNIYKNIEQLYERVIKKIKLSGNNFQILLTYIKQYTKGFLLIIASVYQLWDKDHELPLEQAGHNKAYSPLTQSPYSQLTQSPRHHEHLHRQAGVSLTSLCWKFRFMQQVKVSSLHTKPFCCPDVCTLLCHSGSCPLSIYTWVNCTHSQLSEQYSFTAEWTVLI